MQMPSFPFMQRGRGDPEIFYPSSEGFWNHWANESPGWWSLAHVVQLFEFKRTTVLSFSTTIILRTN
jgi:hypothetical protein